MQKKKGRLNRFSSSEMSEELPAGEKFKDKLLKFSNKDKVFNVYFKIKMNEK